MRDKGFFVGRGDGKHETIDIRHNHLRRWAARRAREDDQEGIFGATNNWRAVGQERASSALAARANCAWGATALLELAVAWAIRRTAEVLPVGLAGAAAADLSCLDRRQRPASTFAGGRGSASAKMRWSQSCASNGTAVVATVRRSGCQVVAA
ncbi:hypothetical protein XAR_2683 [Xanthomonas citri pv. glycines str. 8ra]|nr:hypothetical protein XAR_2683 [Xanthomonas citri pv. glycines str. 8ra]